MDRFKFLDCEGRELDIGDKVEYALEEDDPRDWVRKMWHKRPGIIVELATERPVWERAGQIVGLRPWYRYTPETPDPPPRGSLDGWVTSPQRLRLVAKATYTEVE